MIAKADLAGTAALLTALTTFLGFLVAQGLAWRKNRAAKLALAAKGITDSSAVTGLVTLTERQAAQIELMQDQINGLRGEVKECLDARTTMTEKYERLAEDLRNWFPPRPAS